MTSLVLLIASLRTNIPFVLLFFGLVMLFAFIAAADFLIPSAATLADQEYILKLLKIGGGFGFIGLVCGWYVTIIVACETTGVPCPLPIFDLSGKVPGALEWRRRGGKNKGEGGNGGK